MEVGNVHGDRLLGSSLAFWIIFVEIVKPCNIMFSQNTRAS